ncbi:hypothetical protein LNP18_10085 [Leuconostoc citreum]|uniref:hypothetical protein n=1 Tax=Leuconostoc citreum TaxID=33964 RepID=UPI00200AE36C|nr:hypothetical protein [Leuconostoc citreum]MCK8606446.1 hypothetical protein [Leuconostoc citreum]
MTAIKLGDNIDVLPDSAYQVAKEIFLMIKADYVRLYTGYQSIDKLNASAVQELYIQLVNFYQRYDDRLVPYLAQDLYDQVKQVARLTELVMTCEQALVSLEETVNLITHQYDHETVISEEVSVIQSQYQALLEHVGVEGSVISQIDQAIDGIHGHYRQLNIENKALFFSQLENIHEQVMRYVRHYVEISFTQQLINQGFEQFNTFLRLVVDNAIYRKQTA